MVDMLKTIEAKSDRLNADDLMGGDRVIKVEAVKAGDTPDKVKVFFEGCDGKPWWPCKTMCRAIVAAWGKYPSNYIGKSIQLFRDPNVVYGGMAVGGVRIRAFSDIDGPLTLMLGEKRGKKSVFKFDKLDVTPTPEPEKKPDITERLPGALFAIGKAKDEAALNKITGHASFAALREALGGRATELDAAVTEKRKEWAAPEVNSVDDF